MTSCAKTRAKEKCSMYGRCKCHLGPYEIVIEEKDFILHKMINMNCIYNIFVCIQFKEEILISMQSFFFL